MSPRKSIDDLCRLTGMNRKDVQHIMDMGVEIGSLKKVSDTEYEMTEVGLNITRKINFNNYDSVDPGTWKCSKCNIVNNALNGANCIKCDYSYVDSLASDLMKREPKKYKFSQVNDREILIFLIGYITGMSIGIPTPKGISFKQKMGYTYHLGKVLAELTTNVAEQFPHVSRDEFDEVLLQLNALKTMPILDEAIKKMRDIKP